MKRLVLVVALCVAQVVAMKLLMEDDDDER